MHEIWGDKIEELPGDNFIEQEQIQNAISGKRYWIFPEYDKVWLPEIPHSDFWKIYQRWEDFHDFGLPLGRGSYYETKQTKTILKIGQRAWEASENMKIRNSGKPTIDK